MINRALLLDRDGVINVDKGYVHSTENFEFIDGIFDIARRAVRMSYKLIIITNQAGIGRGYYTEQEFNYLTAWMCEHFLKAGAPIDRVYFSPYHPTEGKGIYLKDDFSRKPQPGMILRAKVELDLDLKSSILIGDKPSDILAGIRAGVGKNLLFASQRTVELHRQDYETIGSLHEALPFLFKNARSQSPK